VTEALAAVLPDCDLIVGTEEELHVAAGCEETLEAARHIRARSDAVIVCKRGPRGCVVFSGAIPERIEAAQVVPGMPIEVYNVLGAGDAFLAGFLLGYLRDAPHETSARYGNGCGALAVSRLLCSAEFPTRRELEHYLAHGSRERALRADAGLSHLHWVTAGRHGPPVVRALTVADPEPPAQAPAPGLGLLAVRAAAAVAAGRDGYGVLLGRSEPVALREGQQRSLWLAWPAGPVAQLIEWPAGITVVYRYGQARELELAALAAACRAQGRELLLEIDVDGEHRVHAEALGALMSRVYALGVRPDWWALAAQLAADPAQRCAEVIAAHDRDCRGVLVTLEAAETAASALAAAAGSSIVRGFIAGGSILADVAAAWRTGQMAPESVSAAIAQRFRTLVDAWVRGGGH
jgi:5-dehydro-2-deoxygluconokinase